MNVFYVLVLFLGLYPLLTNTIRCYKCDATSECKTVSSRTSDYSSGNVEVIDCEHFCWKSISLGNVYRGCAKKRCAVSHTIGTFSSSVCCQADYCNKTPKLFSFKFIFMKIILSLLFLFHHY